MDLRWILRFHGPRVDLGWIFDGLHRSRVDLHGPGVDFHGSGMDFPWISWLSGGFPWISFRGSGVNFCGPGMDLGWIFYGYHGHRVNFHGFGCGMDFPRIS